jgi:pimeloyl-ACP methyl ester carboxylesterase
VHSAFVREIKPLKVCNSHSAFSSAWGGLILRKHVVVLVHGMNTRGEWISTVKPTLEEAGFIVAPAGYGLFSVARFLLPIDWFRARAVARVSKRVRAAITLHKPHRISFIAHSFGTYIVARLLAENFDQNWERIIFCGSIVKNDFPIEQYFRRFFPPIINEIGTRDFWPAMAEAATWGYGSIGSHGFLQAGVEERWHQGLSHSDFLTPGFCATYWVPFLKEGTIVKGTAPEPLPLLVRLLARLPLRWLFFVLLPIILFSAVLAYSLNICWHPACDLTMRIKRSVSFSEAKCVRGERLYSSFVQDDLRFSKFVTHYEARWYFASTGRQPGDTPPVVHDLGTMQRISEYFDNSSAARPYYAYPVNASYWLRARAQWDFRDIEGEPGGVGFVGRYPLTALSFNIRIPPGMKVDPCRDCQTYSDGLDVAGVTAAELAQFRSGCRIDGEGTHVSCSGVSVEPEAQVTYSFTIKNWNVCDRQ